MPTTATITKPANPIAAVLREWHGEMEAQRFKDRKAYRNTVAALFESQGLGDLSDWSRAAVLAYLAAPKADGSPKAGHYRNNVLARIRGFEAWLMNTGKLARDAGVLAGINNDKAGGSTGEGNAAYTTEELRALIRVAGEAKGKTKLAIGERWAVYLMLALTGLRPSELKQVQARDINLREAPFTLEVRPEVAKNGKRRFQPLSAEAVACLEAIGVAKLRPNADVFPIWPGAETVKRDMARAGIDRKDTRGRTKQIYSARKWYCTRLPAEFKGKLLGHGGVTMRYDDPDMGDMAAAVEQLPRLWMVEESGPSSLHPVSSDAKGPKVEAARSKPRVSRVPPSGSDAFSKRAKGLEPSPSSEEVRQAGEGMSPDVGASELHQVAPEVTPERHHRTGGMEALRAPTRAALPTTVIACAELDEEGRLQLAAAALQAAYGAYLEAKREYTRCMAAKVRADARRAAAPVPTEIPQLKIRSA